MTEKSAFFYAENGLVESSNSVWIQWSLDMMISLFERVNLHTNVAKTVVMMCHPVPIAVRQSTPAYGRWMTGDDDSHPLRQRHWSVCTKCGADLEAMSLVAHMETQHDQSGHAMATTAQELVPAPPGGLSGGLPLGVPNNKLSSIGVTREGHQYPQPPGAFYALSCGGHHYHHK